MPRSIVCCFANSVRKKITLLLIMIKERMLVNNGRFCILLAYLSVLSFSESLVRIELINYIGLCNLKIAFEYMFSVLMSYVLRAVSFHLLQQKLMGTKIIIFFFTSIQLQEFPCSLL